MSPSPQVHVAVRRRMSWTARGLVALVVVIALWSGAWWIGSRLVGKQVDAWLVAEQTHGRRWTCPERQMGGYPFALALTCRRLTFEGEVAGHASVGIVEGVTATAGLSAPGSIAIALMSPLNLRAEDGAFLAELSWTALRVAMPLTLGAPDSGSIAAERLAVSISAPAQGDLNIRAQALNGSGERVATEPRDVRFAFDAQGVSFPMLEPIRGLDGPTDAAGRGVLEGAALLTAPTVGRLEAWRQSGGALSLEALSITKGGFAGSAKGRLDLDDAHRPAGRLDAMAAGYGPVAKAFGIPIQGVEIGGLLTSLLTGGKAQPAGKDSMQLPLVLRDGRLSVGPFQTGIALEPLY